jgi:hypothetical protein
VVIHPDRTPNKRVMPFYFVGASCPGLLMDYSAIDALPNPGYGATTRMPAGGPGNQDTNIDLLV